MSTFRVVMLTTAIPEEDISEYRVYVNDELEHTFLPTGVPQTEDFTVEGGARGDLMRLAAVRSSDGQEFEEQAATFTAYRPNITRFEQIGNAVPGGNVTVEADVTLTGGSIDRVDVVYDGTTYQMTETATSGTWEVEMPVTEGTNEAVCTAAEDSSQGLVSEEATLDITGEVAFTTIRSWPDFGAATGDIVETEQGDDIVLANDDNLVREVTAPGDFGGTGLGLRFKPGISTPDIPNAEIAGGVQYEFDVQGVTDEGVETTEDFLVQIIERIEGNHHGFDFIFSALRLNEKWQDTGDGGDSSSNFGSGLTFEDGAHWRIRHTLLDEGANGVRSITETYDFGTDSWIERRDVVRPDITYFTQDFRLNLAGRNNGQSLNSLNFYGLHIRALG